MIYLLINVYEFIYLFIIYKLKASVHSMMDTNAKYLY